MNDRMMNMRAVTKRRTVAALPRFLHAGLRLTLLQSCRGWLLLARSLTSVLSST